MEQLLCLILREHLDALVHALDFLIPRKPARFPPNVAVAINKEHRSREWICEPKLACSFLWLLEAEERLSTGCAAGTITQHALEAWHKASGCALNNIQLERTSRRSRHGSIRSIIVASDAVHAYERLHPSREHALAVSTRNHANERGTMRVGRIVEDKLAQASFAAITRLNSDLGQSVLRALRSELNGRRRKLPTGVTQVLQESPGGSASAR